MVKAIVELVFFPGKGEMAHHGGRGLYTGDKMREARQRRFVRVVALVVLLGAILPTVTYVGHWSIRGLEAAAADTSAGGHANHCHGSSSCADQAAYGLQWWWQGEDAVVLDGGPERALAPEKAPSPRDPVVARLDPPPQYA